MAAAHPEHPGALQREVTAATCRHPTATDYTWLEGTVGTDVCSEASGLGNNWQRLHEISSQYCALLQFGHMRVLFYPRNEL